MQEDEKTQEEGNESRESFRELQPETPQEKQTAGRIDLSKQNTGLNCKIIQKIDPEKRKNLLPPVGAILWSSPLIMPDGQWVRFPYRVTFINESKLRASVEPFAFHKKCEPHEIPRLPPELEEKRRRESPYPHEQGRNPDNVTLGVQSGTMGATAKFKDSRRKE